MNKVYSLGERLLALALCLIMVVSMLPAGYVYAVSNEYGTVTALTAGSVSGNESEKTTVTVKNTGISWNEERDGWWLAVQVAAPAGMTEQEHFAGDERSVCYQTMGTDGEWSGEQAFWDDSEEISGAVRGVTLWSQVTAQLLQTAKEDLRFGWRFDWNMDGEYEQEVILSVQPETVVLLRDGKQEYPVLSGFVFQKAYPNAIRYSETLENPIFEAEKYGDLTYSSSNKNIATVDENGTVTANGIIVGDVTITAKATDPESGESLKASYTLTVNKMPVVVTVEDCTKVYGDEDPSFSYTVNIEAAAKDVRFYGFSRKAGEDVDTYGISVAVDIWSAVYSLPVTNVKSGKLTITPKPVVLTIEDATKAYGAADPEFIYSTDIAVPDDQIEVAVQRVAGESVGEYQVGATVQSKNYAVTVIPGMLTIVKADVEGAVFEKTGDSLSVTYGEDFVNPVAQYEGMGEVRYSVSDKSIATVDENGTVTPVKVGKVTVTATIAATDTHNEKSISYELKINKKPVVLTVDDATKAYGMDDPAFTYTTDVPVPDGVITINRYFREEGEALGKYSVTAVVTIDRNYTVTVKGGILTIIKADPQKPQFEKNDKEYTIQYSDAFVNAVVGGQEKYPTLVYSSSDEEIASVDGNGNITTHKTGTVTISASVPQTATHNEAKTDYTLHVVAKEVVLTVEDKEKTFGEDDPAFTSYTDIEVPEGVITVNGYSRELGESAANGANQYEITADVTVADYYHVTVKTGTLTINPIEVVLTVNDSTKVYGETDPQFSYTTDVAIPEEVIQSIIYQRMDGEDVGQYRVVAVVTASSNYRLTLKSGTLTITKKPVVLTVDDSTKVYGEVDPAFGYTTDVPVEEGALTVNEYLRAPGECAAPQYNQYKVTAKVTADMNHTVTVQYGTLTITQKPFVLTVADSKKVYGDADPEFSYTTDIELPEHVIESIEYYRADEAETVKEGGYLVTARVKANYNYSVTVKSGTMTINPRELTVKADDVSKTRGQADSLSYTLAAGELLEGHELVVELERAAGEEPGAYTVSVKDVYVVNNRQKDNNYSITRETGTMTITGYGELPEGVNYILPETDHEDWYTSDVTISAPAGYKISYQDVLEKENWTESIIYADEYTENTEDLTVYLRSDADGTVYETSVPKDKLKLDKTNPTDLVVAYNAQQDWIEVLGGLFGFNTSSVTVTVSAQDDNSGIAAMYYSTDGTSYTPIEQKNGVYSFKVEPESRAAITVKAVNGAGLETVKKPDGTLVIDTEAPEIVMSCTDAVQKGSIYFTNKENFQVNIQVNDENYDLRENAPTVTVNNNVQTMEWNNSDNSGAAVLALPDEGDYVVKVSFSDRLNDGAESCEFRVDRTAPVIAFSYQNTDQKNTVDGYDIFNADQNLTVRVTEHNFKDSEITVDVKTENGTVYTVPTEWKQVEGSDSYELVLPFTVDDKYTVTVQVKDPAGNAEAVATEMLIVDKTAPAVPTVEYNQTVVSKLLESVSFGYFQPTVEATVTSSDATSGIASIVFSYEGTVGTYSAQAVSGEETVENVNEHTFTLPAGFKGTVKATVTDHAGWISEQTEGKAKDAENNEHKVTNIIIDGVDPIRGEVSYEDVKTELQGAEHTLYFKEQAVLNLPVTELNFVSDEVNVQVNGEKNTDMVWTQGENGSFTGKLTLTEDGEYRIETSYTDRSGNPMDGYASPVLIVDETAPIRTVSYKPTNIVNNETLLDVTEFAEGDAVTLYYNADAQITVEVTEVNFFEEMVQINVWKNGVQTDDYTLSGWSAVEGKEHTYKATLTLTNEGDYGFTVSAKDRSTNEMAGYTSPLIVVDKTLPQISLAYGNETVAAQAEDGRTYYTATQTVTVTVVDHSFRADDVAVVYKALNAADGTVAVNDYDMQGKQRDQWTTVADVHTMVLTFDQDANYELQVNCEDMATNIGGSEKKLFTVDTKAPTAPKIEYSTNFFQRIIDEITFGYYNTKVNITITAEDETSGIQCFEYYCENQGASGVNAGVANTKVTDIQQNGCVYSATFQLPEDVLKKGNQFYGVVGFTAYDIVGKNVGMKDNENVVVVDNIAPTRTITYNGPVNTAGDVSYYDGNIQATIEINEANFDSGDVKVSVTKDGQNYPVKVAWVNNTADRHTGTFTLTEDGDYKVSVSYRDKSGNQMQGYTSSTMTLDTTLPTVSVSNVKADSANKDEVYGFVITVKDTNLDASALAPSLTAVVKAEDGTYQIQPIDLGAAQVVTEGKEYTYTVENLPQDALYTLTCTVRDMSANENRQMLLDDGKTYETVKFSINRNGSTFGYGSSYTDSVVAQYYIYSVDEDLVLMEINADPVEQYTVTLNGKKLTEGTDFTSQQTSEDGEWSKRTYTLNKELFAEEGEYNVVVSSVDKAQTTAYSDMKNGKTAFVVDQTAPVLTITGLEQGGRYQSEAQAVTLIPSDEGGRLNSLKVLVLDSDGNPLTNEETGEDISVRFDMAGEELMEYLDANEGKAEFTIPGGLNNQVRIICDDCAVNSEGARNTYDETFERVTVSQSGLVIFYANKPAFYGTVGGTAGAAGLLVFLLAKKKKKS